MNHQHDFYYKAEYYNLYCECGTAKAVALNSYSRAFLNSMPNVKFSEFEVRRISEILKTGLQAMED